MRQQNPRWFSVDPDFDTAQVLNDYATRFRATSPLALFDGLLMNRRVVENGRKSLTGDASTVVNIEALMHGSHFVLVDPDLNIRGYYAVSSEDTVDSCCRTCVQ